MKKKKKGGILHFAGFEQQFGEYLKVKFLYFEKSLGKKTVMKDNQNSHVEEKVKKKEK